MIPDSTLSTLIDMYICVCNAVTDSQIRQAVEAGARSMRDLQEGLGVAACCGRCGSCAHGVLRAALGMGPCGMQMAAAEPQDTAAGAGLSVQAA